MAMGMTYDEYWYGDVHRAKDYYKAYKIWQEQRNEEAWLHGAYVLRALDATVGNAFRQKGTSPSEYPKQPIGQTLSAQEEQTAQDEEQEALRAKIYMNNMIRAGKNWGKKK